MSVEWICGSTLFRTVEVLSSDVGSLFHSWCPTSAVITVRIHADDNLLGDTIATTVLDLTRFRDFLVDVPINMVYSVLFTNEGCECALRVWLWRWWCVFRKKIRGFMRERMNWIIRAREGLVSPITLIGRWCHPNLVVCIVIMSRHCSSYKTIQYHLHSLGHPPPLNLLST